MTLSRNYFLSKEYLAANGALLTLGKTGVLTVSINCRDNFLGVTLSCYEHLATYGTGLSIFTISFSTGCVTKRGDSFLSNENLAANGTLLTLGKTGVITISINSGDNFLGVTLSGNYGLISKNLTANGALLALGKTVLGTGGLNCGSNNLLVTLCLNYVILIGVATDGTDVSGVTVGGTGGSYSRGIIGMINLIKSLLSLEYFVTYGTVRTFGKTGSGAGRFYGCINNYIVTESLNDLCATYGTGLSVFAVSLSAGGVTERGNFFLGLDDSITLGAMLSCGKTFGSTGCCNGSVLNNGALMIASCLIPLCNKSDRSCYSVAVKVPLLAAEIPALKGVTLTLGILRLGNETALLNLLRSNVGTAVTVELYFKLFCLGSGSAAECAKELVTGSKRDNHYGK